MANGDDGHTNYWWIDLMREAARNLLGVLAIFYVLRMFSEFVSLTVPDDRTQIMLLVIGYLGGLATSVIGFYFGGAMRPIRQVAATTETKPPEPFLPPAPPPAEEKPPAPAAVVASKKPEAEG